MKKIKIKMLNVMFDDGSGEQWEESVKRSSVSNVK